jgi:hypothetical protein
MTCEFCIYCEFDLWCTIKQKRVTLNTPICAKNYIVKTSCSTRHHDKPVNHPKDEYHNEVEHRGGDRKSKKYKEFVLKCLEEKKKYEEVKTA